MRIKSKTKTGGTAKADRCPTTEKQRPRYSLEADIIQELQWMHQQEQKATKKRIYTSDTLAKIIHEAYVIRRAFRN